MGLLIMQRFSSSPSCTCLDSRGSIRLPCSSAIFGSLAMKLEKDHSTSSPVRGSSGIHAPDGRRGAMARGLSGGTGRDLRSAWPYVDVPARSTSEVASFCSQVHIERCSVPIYTSKSCLFGITEGDYRGPAPGSTDGFTRQLMACVASST